MISGHRGSARSYVQCQALSRCSLRASCSLVLILLVNYSNLADSETLVSNTPVCEPECLNGGTCLIDPNSRLPVCICPQESKSGFYYRGTSCQISAVKCNETWWCENAGQCVAQTSEGSFSCSCPLAFEGPKCQTPVQICGDGLWCANGGLCEASEADLGRSICKCPSTHTGVNCQTLVEPQELGGPPVRELDSSGLPGGDFASEERSKYSRIFFGMLVGLLLVWGVAYALVNQQPRKKIRLRSGHYRLNPIREGQVVTRLDVDVEAQEHVKAPLTAAEALEKAYLDRSKEQQVLVPVEENFESNRGAALHADETTRLREGPSSTGEGVG
eukprot:jgi/Mesen1/9105/ME000058S08597